MSKLSQPSSHHYHHLISQSGWRICRGGRCWTLPPPLHHQTPLRELLRAGRGLGFPSTCRRAAWSRAQELKEEFDHTALFETQHPAALRHHLSEDNVQQTCSRHMHLQSPSCLVALRGSAKLPYSLFSAPSLLLLLRNTVKSHSYLKANKTLFCNLKSSKRINSSLILLF